jgi:hypothetical protein
MAEAAAKPVATAFWRELAAERSRGERRAVYRPQALFPGRHAGWIATGRFNGRSAPMAIIANLKENPHEKLCCQRTAGPPGSMSSARLC